MKDILSSSKLGLFQLLFLRMVYLSLTHRYFKGKIYKHIFITQKLIRATFYLFKLGIFSFFSYNIIFLSFICGHFLPSAYMYDQNYINIQQPHEAY